MYSYEFTEQALKDIRKLPLNVQRRIISKLDFFIKSKNPMGFASRLISAEAGQYRFRVGDYRIIFDLENTIIIILTIGHRKDIYK